MTTIHDIYRAVIARSAAAGVQRREANDTAVGLIQAEITAGRIAIDVERAIRAELAAADEKDGAYADSLLARAASGQPPLFETDLDVVVVLGRGRRKTWAWVQEEDLTDMLALRWGNVVAQRNAYRETQRHVSAIRSTVIKFGTFGAAVTAGGFGDRAVA